MATEDVRELALTTVTNATRRDVVVDAIRRAVLSGELTPGQRVKEASLADALGVSRPTIREALHQLIHEGSLVQEPYKGIRVANPSPLDLLQVAQVRVPLETLAALELAKHPDGEGMARLRLALHVHLDAIDSGDLVKGNLTHLEWHRTLWEGADNPMLNRIWPLVESQVRMAIALDQAARDDLARDAEMHRHLVDLIVSGDEERITAEVRAHIEKSARELVKLVQCRPG
jgi:DNA-binding GntR family transcriptional regulator